MMVAEGILTARGGLVSHAAVVARGWGTPAVVGAEAVQDRAASSSRVGDIVVNEGDVISLDGTTGEVVLGEVELAAAEPPPEFDTILGWADAVRKGKLGVRANADTGAGRRQRPRASAPRASACAAPSTCSSARTACRSCAG